MEFSFALDKRQVKLVNHERRWKGFLGCHILNSAASFLCGLRGVGLSSPGYKTAY